MMMPCRPHLRAALLLTAVVVACYANSLPNGFTYDDLAVVVNNTMIKAPDRLFTTLLSREYLSEAGDPNYRPLVTLSYALDYWLWGLNPFGFHLTNLLLHLLTTFGVYALFLRLLPSPGYPHSGWGGGVPAAAGRRPGEGGGEGPGWREGLSWPALIGAALFAAHPALTEAVDGIGFRDDVLATLFFLIALGSLLEHPEQPTRGRRMAFGLGAYGLALLAKEVAGVLPLMLFLCDVAQGRITRAQWRARLPVYAALGLLAAGYLFVRLGAMALPGVAMPLGARLTLVPLATWTHLRLLIAPVGLATQYLFRPASVMTDPMVLFPLALLACVGLGLLWLAVRGERLACVGLIWIIVALAPVTNVIPGASIVAERYLYLPAVGWALLLVIALGRLRSRPLAIGLTGLLLLTYGTLTLQRNIVWRDSFTLWQDEVEKRPENALAHHNLGVSYEERGALEPAVREYAWATSLESGYTDAYYNAGRAYTGLGRLDHAVRQLQQALQLNPRHAAALAELGGVYHRQGRLTQAMALYRAALADPRYGVLSQGRIKTLSPPAIAEIYANLGAAYVAIGQRALAMEAFQEALRRTPQEAVLHNNIGNLYAEGGKMDKAIEAYQAALRLNPRFAGAHANLAAVYARLGRHADAAAERAAARRGGPQ